MTEFYEAKAGRIFFEVTLPRLIAAIERLAEALEEESLPRTGAARNRSFGVPAPL